MIVTDTTDADVTELLISRKPLRTVLLFLLAEEPGHGYALISRLQPMGFNPASPARLYRALGWLEQRGFIQAHWDTTGPGPARRIYRIALKGVDLMHVHDDAIYAWAKKAADDPMAKYVLTRLRRHRRDAIDFTFNAAVTITISAEDEAAARRKLVRALQPGRHWSDIHARPEGHVSLDLV